MALTKAEKSKAYRERKLAKGMEPKTVWLSKTVIDVINEYTKITGETQSEAIENILMTWACDAAEEMPQLLKVLNKGSTQNSEHKPR